MSLQFVLSCNTRRHLSNIIQHLHIIFNTHPYEWANQHLSNWITCHWKIQTKSSGNFAVCICIQCSEADSSRNELLRRVRAERSLLRWERNNTPMCGGWKTTSLWKPHAGNPLPYCTGLNREWLNRPDTVSLLPLGHMSQDHLRIVLLSHHVLVMLGLHIFLFKS